MTDLERQLLAHLRRVTYTSAPQWSEVHKAWIMELSCGHPAFEFRELLERYREQESVP